MARWWMSGREQAAEVERVVSGRGLRDSLTAAARVIEQGRERIIPQYETWQDEVWDFYDQLGEFRYAVSWKANMISRVRLRAARTGPNRDEPEIVDEGLAAELVAELGGGTGGQAQLLAELSTHNDVPGESWLVGEEDGNGSTWRIYSSDEIRFQSGRYQVITDESTPQRERWRTLGPDSLVVRVWRPHKRWHHVADSPARAARPIMRELELVNRHIQSQYLSRLATAGVFIMPDEVTFPVREEFADAPDPFVQEWIETAREAIANPGTAAAVIPIPMRVPAEFTKAFEHIDFTVKLDEKIIEKRESAIRRLAMELDIPAEVLLGMGDVNHWSAFFLEEQAIKAHIAPDVELITHMLTVGYLHPRMRAAGEDVDDWVVWYDASELTVRPDRSANALQAYDRFEISGKALRRETGFDEDDEPSDDELKEQILKAVAKNPQAAFAALAELTGDDSLMPPAPPAPAVDEAPQEDAPEQEERGAPETRDEPPPEEALTRQLRQAGAPHVLAFTVDSWALRHSQLCQEHLFSCPFTHAVATGVVARPGASGEYEVRLSEKGELQIGQRVFTRPGELIESSYRSSGNGARTRT